MKKYFIAGVITYIVWDQYLVKWMIKIDRHFDNRFNV